jgi:ribosome biogenesis GTPase
MTTEEMNRQGIVVKKMLGKYTVRSAGGSPIVCTLTGNLTKRLMYSIADPSSMPKRVLDVKEIDTVDPVAVGDEVSYHVAEDGSGVIAAIHPRKNKLSRPATDGNREYKKGGPREQVIIANVDQIVVVVPAAHPPPSWNLLDRYLATAEASDIPAIICFTKADLLPADWAPTPDEPAAWKPPLLPEIALYQQIGYRVLLTSAVSGLGIDEMKAALQDRVSVLWGKSGVGKTSLLNALEPGLGLRVKAVNDHNSEGRHATTHLEMFELPFGGGVIDTPGQRAFKIWNEIDDYAQLLPEMRDYIGRCKFGLDCTHTHEPGCAIKSAVSSGAITSRRYESFLGMKEYFGG